MNRKRGSIALLLSLLQPGLAQLYNRQPKKAALAAASTPILLFISRLLSLAYTFRGLVALLFLGITITIWIAVDACRAGLRHPKGAPLPAMNPAFLTLTILLMAVNIIGGTHLIGRVLGIRAFIESASSMTPTVKQRDRFIVDTSAYDKNSPARGDLVVFLVPADPSTVFVKRVAAVSGDTVEGDSQGLELNGQVVKTLFPAGPPIGPSEVRDFDRVTVPQDSVFVLGDNIINSNDSRYFGPVPIKSVLGKVLFIYWSPDHFRIGRPVR